MKKNRLLMPLFVLMSLVFVLSACHKAPPDGPETEATEIRAPQESSVLRLTMYTSATSGNYYPFGAALAQVVGEASNYLVIDVQTSVDPSENIEHVAAGEAQLAMAQNDILNYVFNSTGIWQDKPPITTMAPLMTLYPEVCQLVVGANSGLITVEDLKGKRVAIGEDGTALQVGAWNILAECGLSEEDIEALPMGFSEAAQAMREKSIDAFFVTAGTPNKNLMDLQVDRELAIISLDEDIITALLEKYPFYTRYTLNENDYSFLSEPVDTVAVKTTLVAANSLSAQAAYDLVKTIIENSDKVAVAHAKGMYISAEEAVTGLPMQLHEGALRYFLEIGAITEPPQDEAPDDEAADDKTPEGEQQ